MLLVFFRHKNHHSNIDVSIKTSPIYRGVLLTEIC